MLSQIPVAGLTLVDMKVYEKIDGRLRDFILAQRMFFVGSAPTSIEGNVNISPRAGAGSFVIIDEHTVAFADLTGSGSETAAHLRDNGRIVLMFCAFEGRPNVVRLHGRGQLVLPGSSPWSQLRPLFVLDAPDPAVRAIVTVDVHRVSDSCGFTVPFYDYVGPRTLLDDWASRKTPEELQAYRELKNSLSIDGLAAFSP